MTRPMKNSDRKLKTCICLLLVLLAILPETAYGSGPFRNLTVNDGLAHTDANCITQDSTGMIWIGTFAGLQSYDGYTFRTFDYYADGSKIYKSHNRIKALSCAGNYLWVGTESGLACFGLKTSTYVPYKLSGDGSDYLRTHEVTELFTDRPSGLMLARTWDRLYVAKGKGNAFRTCRWKNTKEHDLCQYASDYQIHEGHIWVSREKEIFRLETTADGTEVFIQKTLDLSSVLEAGETIRAFFFHEKRLYLRTSEAFYRFATDGKDTSVPTPEAMRFVDLRNKIGSVNRLFTIAGNGSLWCAYDEGILEIKQPFSSHATTKTFQIARHKMSPQKITDLWTDKYDNIWITGFSWGIFYKNLSESFFRNILQDNPYGSGFRQDEATSICEQTDGKVWTILEYGNLLCYDPKTKTRTSFPLRQMNEQTVYYQTLCPGTDEKILYIGSNYGLFVYDIRSGCLNRVHASGTGHDAFARASIAHMANDKFGRLWIGTWGEGVFCIENLNSRPTIAYHYTPQTSPAVASKRITHITPKNNVIFLATENGLNRIRMDGNGKVTEVSSYRAGEDIPQSLKTNYLADVDCENDSVCWVGTIGGGLSRITIHSEKDNDYTASNYTAKDGLPGNDCEIVMLDSAGNVWIGGNRISRLTPKSGRIYTYSSDDGFQNAAFKINVAYKGHNGLLYMGGLSGVTVFNPLRLPKEEASAHDLVFTGLSVNNKRISPSEAYGGNVILHSSIGYTKKVKLKYFQNNFTLFFSALGYRAYDQILYRYRFAENDKWTILPRHTNNISFSNLAYGTYRLDVQYSTDQGSSWSAPGKRMQITILPPWWWSWPAKCTYLLGFVCLAALFVRRYTRERILEKENEIQKLLLKQDEEKYQAKIRFFMNASHELKTPLTLIMLAAEKRKGEAPEDNGNRIILRNAKKMLSLIAELVDIRKTELGIAKLDFSPLNFSELTARLYEDLLPWATNKHITMSCTDNDGNITLEADGNRLGKMIANLITNAIKYTNEGGRIEIRLHRGTLADAVPFYKTAFTEGSMDKGEEACILNVRDTGVGISPESIRQIYERFFQVEGEPQSHLGSGIGLAIVKNIVMQHQGVITVSSERLKGTEFIVTLPLKQTEKKTEESHAHIFDFDSFINETYNELPPLKKGEQTETSKMEKQTERSTLLIVEDNKELQKTLKEHFSIHYNIETADNGKEGFEKCVSLFPDMIISDVMMPEMDGIKMCRQIKNNLSVAYIPLILLTAKDDVESQIEGYESGADLYLPKPFSMKLLETNIKRLLTQQEQRFKGIKDTETNSQLTINLSAYQNDEVANLTRQLKQIVNDNLNNPSLTPDYLASAIGVSRSKLYKNIGKIDGESFADYIRNARLERACLLLSNTNLNVQEIMEEVGFVNNSHFTKIFKLKYGIPPTEYKNRNIKTKA